MIDLNASRRDMIEMSLVSPEYFQIFVEIGFSTLASMFDDGPDRRAFMALEGLYERYGIFNCQTMLAKADKKTRDLLQEYIYSATANEAIMDQVKDLSSKDWNKSYEERQVILMEITERLNQFQNYAIEKINKSILEKINDDPRSSIDDLLESRDALLGASQRVSKMKEWGKVYEEESHKQELEAYHTGIDILDDHFKMHPGNIFALAGAPGAGKTTMANQWLVDWAEGCDGDYSSLYFNLETSERRMLQVLNERLEVKYGGKKEKIEEWHRNAKLKFASDIYMADDICDEISRAKRIDPNLRFVVIDYVQLVKNKGVKNQLFDQVTATVEKLRYGNMDWNIFIVILSQLGTESYQKGKEPTLASLKGSGMIVEASSYVMTLHEYEPDDGGTGDGFKDIKAKLLKSRYSAAENFNLVFNGAGKTFFHV